jgi:hypothetical protein
MRPVLTAQDLAAFTGDLDRYRHPINRKVIYTPGVQYLAEAGGAYWLIDVVASWIGSHSFNRAKEADPRIESLHHWSLEVADDRGVVKAWIQSEEPPFAPAVFVTQKIPFTDFPLPEVHLWCGFDGENWTLFLPSEY